MDEPSFRVTAVFASLLLFSHFRPSHSQVTSAPIVSSTPTVRAPSGCEECTLNPATTEISDFALETYGASATGPASIPNVYVLFTAYSITSAYLSDGVCSTISGPPITLDAAMSLTKPTTADPTDFRSGAIPMFRDFIGFTTCSPGGVVGVVNIPTDTVISSSTTFPSGLSVTPLFNATSTSSIPSSSPSPALEKQPSGISTKHKVAISLVIPTVVIAFLSLGVIYLWRKRKEKESAKGSDASIDSAEDTQPYLQRKAELDSDERKEQLELDAQELRYEMDGANTRHEVEGANKSNEVSAEGTRRKPLSLGLTHELRGEEHSKELECPEI